MAVTKIHPIKTTLNKAIDYICNPDKTDNQILISSFGCSYQTADIEFDFTLSKAREKGDNLGHHLIQSFAPGEVSYEEAHRIGKELADKVLGGRYEYVLTTHIDKGHIHNHIIFCAVDFVSHRKYVSNKKSYYQIRNESDRLCKEHGLSVITPGQDKGKKYAEWDAERKGTSWKAKLKVVIDATIPKAKNFDDFLRLMQAAGYEIKQGKFVSFRAPGQERFTRSKTLGEAYTVEAITERIAGTYRAKPKVLRQEKAGVSLLIDIQNSIKAAESRGYEQWAKIHNLKQAAKTLNFLTEHDISEYEQLQTVLDEVHTESEQTAATLKQLGNRLSDISLLMKSISAYQQTKEVYTQYKKAKDKEKFLRGNESSIIIHEAAAKTLRAARNSGKSPDFKKLHAEYKELTEQKDKLYQEYGNLKKKVKQYDTIKQNVDNILRQAKQPEREKENVR